jgi:hypothetical protein
MLRLCIPFIILFSSFNLYAQKKGTVHVKKKSSDVSVKIVNDNAIHLNQPNSFEIIFAAKCKDAKVLMEGVRFSRKGNIYTFTPLNQRPIVLICICNGIEIYRKSYQVGNTSLVDSVGWGK